MSQQKCSVTRDFAAHIGYETSTLLLPEIIRENSSSASLLYAERDAIFFHLTLYSPKGRLYY